MYKFILLLVFSSHWLHYSLFRFSLKIASFLFDVLATLSRVLVKFLLNVAVLTFFFLKFIVVYHLKNQGVDE